MDETPKHLRLLPPADAKEEGFNDELSEDEIANLDVSKLQRIMAKNMLILEAALFGQAGHEHARIEKMRGVIDEFETVIFEPEFFKGLDAKGKQALYKMAIENRAASLMFLQDLHNNMGKGMEAIAHIQKLKEPPKAVGNTPTETKALEELKILIRKKIQERVENK